VRPDIMIATSTGIVSPSQSLKIAGQGLFQHSASSEITQRRVIRSTSSEGVMIKTASNAIAHFAASNGGRSVSGSPSQSHY
jgi:hypothetical protein